MARVLICLAVLGAFVISAGPIPAGWVCVGNCGSSYANDGVVVLPTGVDQVLWVSTFNGAPAGGTLTEVGGSSTNGSALTSPLFAVTAGETLRFFFNYVTSDGANYADYAWARLLPEVGSPLTLFTARSTPAGNTVPGFGMPPVASGVVLNPAAVVITPGATIWSPLGVSSGSCYSTGCGSTGWVEMTYVASLSGNYRLAIGVSNWLDESYNSGLAIANATVGGRDIINAVPEPSTYALMGAGLLMLVLHRRRQ